MRLPTRSYTVWPAAAALLLTASAAAQQKTVAPRVVSVATHPAAPAASSASLEEGFHRLYELRFAEALAEFRAFQKAQPEDPMGPTAEAASFLFEEFHKHGVLSSDFFLDNDRFLEGIDGDPTPELRKGFFDSLDRGELLVRSLLQKNPKNTDAMYVDAILTGMLGNYRSLVEKKHFEGVRLTEKAEGMAEKLLKLRPDIQDAYLAIGASNYIVGCLPRTKRFFLWFGGVAGDREAGLAQLKRAAEGGNLLRPYAKILLALAALREKDPALAHRLFAELSSEFPRNPQFSRELALLNKEVGELSRP